MSDAQLRAIRRRMALAALPPLPPEQLGAVQLLLHQRQAAARLLRILQWHHGALLADDVGLGKTFTALAVARRYDRVHVLAPAGLVAMWQAALLQTHQHHICVHSLHRSSRQPPEPFAPSNDSARPLVVIDEAHALRNPATVRYKHLADALTGCDVLLISATPLHNSPRDLQALFALFRGERADTLHHETLSALIVRRDHRAALPLAMRPPSPVGASGERPRVQRHRPLIVPQDRQTLELLLALPAPLPTHDGAVAGALIRLGLLRAWCSSDAALTHALTRRIQRGTALRDGLNSGRRLSAAELRSWVIGDDDALEMQLGFPELLGNHAIESTADASHSPERIVEAHLQALRTLREHHVATARADRVRAALVRQVRERHPGVPVVAFSQYGRTVQALYRALSDIAGVGMLTGSSARIASGSVSRPELLEHFAPRAHGRPPPPAHRAVTVLLATDLIAEGVNLQDAGVVVHLDLPWTDALRKQRTGRVARLGSRFSTVHEYRVRASHPARQALNAERRVAQKAAMGARYVGHSPGVHTRARQSGADTATQWLSTLEAWVSSSDMEGDAPEKGASAARMAVLPVSAPQNGGIVLVNTLEGARLIAVTQQGTRWRVSARTRALLRLVRPSHASHAVSPSRTEHLSRVIHAAVRGWHAHRLARMAAGVHVGVGFGDGVGMRAEEFGEVRAACNPTGPLSTTQRRALRWLQERVAQCTLIERRQLSAAIDLAKRCIVGATGVAAEQALGRWMAESHETSAAHLVSWRAIPVLSRASRNAEFAVTAAQTPADADQMEIEACLLLAAPPGS